MSTVRISAYQEDEDEDTIKPTTDKVLNLEASSD